MPRFWIPALAFALLQGLGMGLFGIFGFFLKPVAETFQAKEAVIASGLSLLVLVPALTGALVGKLVDRAPMRRLLLAGAWIAMGFLLLLPLAQHTWQLGLLFLGFVVGIVLYGPQATNVFLIRCYPQHQGRALAMAAVGVSVASIVLPPLTAALMANLSWQRSLQCLGVLILVVLTIAVRYGVPTGRGDASAVSSGPADFSDPIVRAALRSRPFWCVGIGFAILQSLMTVSSVCFVPHFMLMGLSAEAAGSLIAVGGVAGLIGKLSMATLADNLRQRVPLLCMGLSLLQICGWSLFWVVESYQGLALAATLVGLSGGASLPMFAFANSQYFPASILGRINGVQMAFYLPFGLIAPPLAGYAFDTTGSYLPAFAGVAVINGFGLMLFAALPRLERRSVTSVVACER